MKIAFVLNGSSKKLMHIINRIEYVFKDSDFIPFLSDKEGHIIELTKSAVLSDCDTIIACGGDGTLNETVNGVIEAFKLDSGSEPESYDWEKISKIRIGLYPVGSGNDFAKTIDVSTDLHKLKYLIEKGDSELIDVGWVRFNDFDGQPLVRFFQNITDVGMGGETVAKLRNKYTRALGASFNYLWSISTTLLTYKNAKVRATGKDFSYEGHVMNFVVANGKYFGKGLCIAPDASITDGQFEIVILGDVTLKDFAKNLNKLKQGETIDHPKVKYHRTDEVTIESLDEGRDLSIDMDGEYIGHAPLTLRCLQKRIRFIY